MRFIILLSISSLFASVTTQKPSHGRIVSCPIFTQTVISSVGFDFKNEDMDWSHCTRLTILDEQITKTKSKKYSEMKKINVVMIFIFFFSNNSCYRYWVRERCRKDREIERKISSEGKRALLYKNDTKCVSDGIWMRHEIFFF